MIERALRRDVAQAGRAVPQRRRLRRRAHRRRSTPSRSARASRTARSSAGLVALEVEANRVEQHGFGAGELDRARKWMLASYDRAYAERDKTESGSYVQEYINNFLQGEPTPGHRLRAQAGAGARADDHRPRKSRPRPRRCSPTPAASSSACRRRRRTSRSRPTHRLDAADHAADAVAVTPWADTASTAALLERAPDPGTVVEPARDPRARRHRRHASRTASKRG